MLIVSQHRHATFHSETNGDKDDDDPVSTFPFSPQNTADEPGLLSLSSRHALKISSTDTTSTWTTPLSQPNTRLRILRPAIGHPTSAMLRATTSKVGHGQLNGATSAIGTTSHPATIGISVSSTRGTRSTTWRTSTRTGWSGSAIDLAVKRRTRASGKGRASSTTSFCTADAHGCNDGQSMESLRGGLYAARL